MAKDADKIVVAATGSVYAAPIATTPPTDATTGLNAAFIDLGYVSEDGVTVTIGKNVEEIRAWQSAEPIRRIVTARSMKVSFTLMEWKEWTLEVATGGATADNSAQWKLTPPDADDLTELAYVVQWLDGANDYRLYIPRALVVEDVEFNLARTTNAGLPVTLEATVDVDTDAPWTLFSDMAALDPDTE